MNFVIVLTLDDIVVEVENGSDAILAVVFRRFRVNGDHEVSMGAEAEVVGETPMEKHRLVDERAAVEEEDELSGRPHMLEVLHRVSIGGGVALRLEKAREMA